MIGPRQMTRVGISHAIEVLLEVLPAATKEIEHFWVWAAQDTTEVSRMVQAWKSGRGKIYTRAPKESMANEAWELAIIVPRINKATREAQTLVDSRRPCCILMPTELIYYTAQRTDGTFDEQTMAILKKAKKHTIVACDMTWVCINTNVEHNDVHARESSTMPPGPTNLVWTPAVGTLEQWATEQEASLKTETKLDKARLYQRKISNLYLYKGTDNIDRVYVPVGRRDAVIEMHHKAIHHLAADKTHKSLTRYLYWPTSRRDTHRHYSKCAFCEISKAKRNLSHKHSRAVESHPPRSRYGCDYYGVGTQEIFGIIDLDSLNVTLTLHESRSADAVRRTIRDKILFREGRIDELRSDHAREFVGRAMTALSKETGYLATTTGGYNATGNSTMERFWGFLGVCLRSLSDKEYQNVGDYLQSMAFAWNSTESESLTVSPFNVMTGTTPRTIADGILAPTIESRGDLDIPAICASAAEYTRIARANADYMRKLNAENLNANGRLLKPLTVGSFVKIYMPPGHDQAVKHDRKAKHMLAWHGPMRITEIDGTLYVLEYKYNTAQTYKRHLCNIRRWNGPVPDEAPQVTTDAAKPEPIKDIEVGTLILARDAEGAKTLDLGKVIEIHEDEVTVQCYGTRGKSLKTAIFRPMFASKTNVSFGKSVDGMVPYTWTIKSDDFKELIPRTGLQLTKSGTLSAASIKKIFTIKPKAKMRIY